MSTRRKTLKLLNAPVVAKPMRPTGMRDDKVRELVKGTDAETDVETALRDSRRANEKYNKGQVHVGAVPQDDYVGGPQPVGAEVQPKLTAHCGAHEKYTKSCNACRAERRAAAIERRALRQSASAAAKAANAAATGDKDGPARSASEVQPFTGPNFRETERDSRGRSAAASERERQRDKLAWAAFELDRPTEAAEIAKVWKRSHADRDMGEEAGREILRDTVAFALAVESFVKKSVTTKAGRSRRYGDLTQYWRDWRAYREQWARNNPEVRLPDVPSERAEPVYTPALKPVPEAVALALYRQQQLPSPIAAEPDPLEAAWEARGLPVGRGDARSGNPWARPLFRVKPLEQILRSVDEIARWELPVQARSLENNARADYWNVFARYKPRWPWDK